MKPLIFAYFISFPDYILMGLDSIHSSEVVATDLKKVVYMNGENHFCEKQIFIFLFSSYISLLRIISPSCQFDIKITIIELRELLFHLDFT